jgi:hypothetical protein
MIGVGFLALQAIGEAPAQISYVAHSSMLTCMKTGMSFTSVILQTS